MNIHPLFVHLPIGILIFYGGLEFLSLIPRIQGEHWFFTRGLSVIVGSCAAFITLQTGELAERLFFGDSSSHALIELHSTMATGATIVFTTLAVGYLVSWLTRTYSFPHTHWLPAFSKLWNGARFLSTFVLFPWVRIPLVLIGLGLLTITGALGAALVYGPDIDPVVRIIYSLFQGML